MKEKLDPIFCLESLERYLPAAKFTMTVTSGQNTPHTALQVHMESTGNPIHKGLGEWVRYDDVLRLMITLKDQSQ